MAFLELTIHHSQLEGGNIRPASALSLAGNDANDFILGDQTGPYYARLRQRRTWPETYMLPMDEDTVVMGYGPANPRSDTEDFLQIALRENGELFVRRDVQCTLPLFYGSDGESFCLSNDYGVVFRALKKRTPHKDMIIEMLGGHSAERYSTQWQEIKVLGESHILEVDGRGRTTLRQPPSRSWSISKHAPKTDPKQFSLVFRKTLERFITEKLSGQRFALEASGGLDSSALPLYLGETRGRADGLLVTAAYGGDFYTSQQAKLSLLSEKTGFYSIQRLLTPELRYYPALTVDDKTPQYAHQGLYEGVFEELADELQQQGVTIVATGEGGDDCHENSTSRGKHFGYGVTERKRRQEATLPPFLTPLFQRQYAAVTPTTQPIPTPQLSLSYHSSQVSINNTYIERGIWPVTPYADVGLVNYIQGVPAYLRKDKKLLRLFFEAHNWPEPLYRKEGNEHFSLFFNEAMTSGAYDAVISHYAAHGHTVKEGLVNGGKLQELYHNAKTGLDPRSESYLYPLLMWLRLETNLALGHASALFGKKEASGTVGSPEAL